MVFIQRNENGIPDKETHITNYKLNFTTMNTYMVIIQLPKQLTDEFLSLVPMQRECINELMNEGKILQYSLAIDRSNLWLTISAHSKAQAVDIVSSFPLIGYMKPHFIELALYNSISTELPKLIMN